MKRSVARVGAAAGAFAVIAGLVCCSSSGDPPGGAHDAATDVEDASDGSVFDSGQFKVPDAAPAGPMPDVHVDAVEAPPP